MTAWALAVSRALLGPRPAGAVCGRLLGVQLLKYATFFGSTGGLPSGAAAVVVSVLVPGAGSVTVGRRALLGSSSGCRSPSAPLSTLRVAESSLSRRCSSLAASGWVHSEREEKSCRTGPSYTLACLSPQIATGAVMRAHAQSSVLPLARRVRAVAWMLTSSN